MLAQSFGLSLLAAIAGNLRPRHGNVNGVVDRGLQDFAEVGDDGRGPGVAFAHISELLVGGAVALLVAEPVACLTLLASHST